MSACMHGERVHACAGGACMVYILLDGGKYHHD